MIVAFVLTLVVFIHIGSSIRPIIPHLARPVTIHLIREVPLNKGSESLSDSACGFSSTIVHKQLLMCNDNMSDIYAVPHSAILHNGEICGTGKSNEYTLLIPGDKLLTRARAKLFNLENIYNVLMANGRAFNAFDVLVKIDPVLFGIEFGADRICGGKKRYPRGTTYFFLHLPQTGKRLDFRFAFLNLDELGMLSIQPDEEICLFKRSRGLGPSQSPFASPTPSTTPANRKRQPLNVYNFENISPRQRCFPAYPVGPEGSRLPRPSKSPSPVPSISRSISVSPSVSPSRASGLPVPDKATSPSPSTEGNGVCFPSSAIVQLEGGREIPIGNLKIGDRVLGAGGKYSDVYTFTHNVQNTYFTFLRLKTTRNLSITLSSMHYLQISHNKLKSARAFTVGDYLLLFDGKPAQVTSIKHVRSKGLHNPQTTGGTIVVNGIIASTFTETVRPSTANALLAPLKFFYLYLGWAWCGLPNGSSLLGQFLPAGGDVW